MKLRKNLMSYNLCDPGYYKDSIDADYTAGTEFDEAHAEYQ